MKHLIAILSTGVLAACQGSPTAETVSLTDRDSFGAGVAAEGETLSVASLAADAPNHHGQTIRLAAVVQSVCKRKGCWMRVGDGDQEVFVQFVDYGFFVPLDCEGREAVLEGEFSVVETSVDELRHYLEDEGKHAEAAQVAEPRVEMKLLATGVALSRGR